MELHYGDFYHFIKTLKDVTIKFCEEYIHQTFWRYLQRQYKINVTSNFHVRIETGGKAEESEDQEYDDIYVQKTGMEMITDVKNLLVKINHMSDR